MCGQVDGWLASWVVGTQVDLVNLATQPYHRTWRGTQGHTSTMLTLRRLKDSVTDERLLILNQNKEEHSAPSKYYNCKAKTNACAT